MGGNMNIFIIGNGAHAVSLVALLTTLKYGIEGIVEFFKVEHCTIGRGIKDIPLINENDFISKKSQGTSLLINGIGSVKDMIKRYEVFDKFKKMNYKFKTIIDPSAVIAGDVILGEGVQVMAGAIIQTGCIIGDDTIVNTGVIIDHTCVVGSHVHLAPGVVLSGGVTIGDMSHIGTAATIIQGIKIGCNALIAAGAVVINDIPNKAKAMGVPAKILL